MTSSPKLPPNIAGLGSGTKEGKGEKRGYENRWRGQRQGTTEGDLHGFLADGAGDGLHGGDIRCPSRQRGGGDRKGEHFSKANPAPSHVEILVKAQGVVTAIGAKRAQTSTLLA